MNGIAIYSSGKLIGYLTFYEVSQSKSMRKPRVLTKCNMAICKDTIKFVDFESACSVVEFLNNSTNDYNFVYKDIGKLVAKEKASAEK